MLSYTMACTLFIYLYRCFIVSGSLENSLCSSESVLSSCLPTDHTGFGHLADLPAWKRDSFKLPNSHAKLGALKDKSFLLKAAGGPDSREGSRLSIKGGATQRPVSPGTLIQGNGVILEDRRMSTNGIQGSAMTGSTNPQGDSLQWIATDVPSTQTGSQPSHQRPATSLGGGAPRDLLLPNPVNPPVSRLFNETSSGRLYPGQYGPTYPATTTASLSPYASLYNQPLVSPYFLPYPYNTSSSLLSSYSGVEHTNPYPGYLMFNRPYPGSSSQYLAGQNSPGTLPRTITPSHLDRGKSPKLDDRARGSPKDVKEHMTPPLAHQHPPHHVTRGSHRDPTQDTKEAGYKSVLPSQQGLQGLTPHFDPNKRSDPSPPRRTAPFLRPNIPVKTEEPPPKRSRIEPQATYSRGPADPSQPHYPPHFMKGSIIQLANGDLKRVEDLRTEDFVHSAEISNDLKIDSSTVVKIDENPDRGTALLGFSVGEHRVQVSYRQVFTLTVL